jgi:hypothetical protein
MARGGTPSVAKYCHQSVVRHSQAPLGARPITLFVAVFTRPNRGGRRQRASWFFTCNFKAHECLGRAD